MREIAAQRITDAVRRLCIQANCHLPRDVRERIAASHDGEPWRTPSWMASATSPSMWTS